MEAEGLFVFFETLLHRVERRSYSDRLDEFLSQEYHNFVSNALVELKKSEHHTARVLHIVKQEPLGRLF
jgi:hypothetical protein